MRPETCKTGSQRMLYSDWVFVFSYKDNERSRVVNDRQLHHNWELVRSGIKVPTQNYWINICVSTAAWVAFARRSLRSSSLSWVLLCSLLHLTSSYSPKFPKWPSGDTPLGLLFCSQILIFLWTFSFYVWVGIKESLFPASGPGWFSL